MIDHSSDLITIIKSLMAKPSLDETERLSVYEKLFNLYKDIGGIVTVALQELCCKTILPQRQKHF